MERFYKVLGDIALAMVFFCFVTPLSLFLRASGRDPLNRKMSAAKKSYWHTRTPKSADFVKQSLPR